MLPFAMASTPLVNQSTQPPEEPIAIPAHLDGIAYLYGHPLLNSLSPPLHQTVYTALNLNWTQIPLSSIYGSSSTYPPPYTRSPPIEKFLASIRANPKFVGSSVTMPWKVNIMKDGYLDDLTEDARQAGACNTIFLSERNGKKAFIGTNTDCIGIREALLQNRLEGDENQFRGKPALIIGGGGTARTAIYVLRKWLGASAIYIVNRDRDEIQTILEEDERRNPGPGKARIIPVFESREASRLESPAAIVSGIPNYPPRTPDEVRAREVIKAFLAGESGKPKGVILEMCYHPVPWTEIGQLASSAGWKVILGSEALIWQGLEQSRLWTGRDVAAVPGLVDKVKDVVSRSIADRAPAGSKI